MARTAAGLPPGTRLTDHISLGVLTARFPIETVHEVLQRTGRASQRERDLPAHVMVYYAMALALTGAPGALEHLMHRLDREPGRQHPEADVIREPGARGESCSGPRHAV